MNKELYIHMFTWYRTYKHQRLLILDETPSYYYVWKWRDFYREHSSKDNRYRYKIQKKKLKKIEDIRNIDSFLCSSFVNDRCIIEDDEFDIKLWLFKRYLEEDSLKKINDAQHNLDLSHEL